MSEVQNFLNKKTPRTENNLMNENNIGYLKNQNQDLSN